MFQVQVYGAATALGWWLSSAVTTPGPRRERSWKFSSWRSSPSWPLSSTAFCGHEPPTDTNTAHRESCRQRSCHDRNHRPAARPSVSGRIRPWWLWIVTALAFPPAGFIGHEVVGRVDGVGAALLSGVITGALIGLAQWALLRGRGASPRWIVATAAGFGIGLSAGAALVGYETSLGALVAMGAVCGVAIGLAQVASFAPCDAMPCLGHSPPVRSGRSVGR